MAWARPSWARRPSRWPRHLRGLPGHPRRPHAVGCHRARRGPASARAGRCRSLTRSTVTRTRTCGTPVHSVPRRSVRAGCLQRPRSTRARRRARRVPGLRSYRPARATRSAARTTRSRERLARWRGVAGQAIEQRDGEGPRSMEALRHASGRLAVQQHTAPGRLAPPGGASGASGRPTSSRRPSPALRPGPLPPAPCLPPATSRRPAPSRPPWPVPSPPRWPPSPLPPRRHRHP